MTRTTVAVNTWGCDVEKYVFVGEDSHFLRKVVGVKAPTIRDAVQHINDNKYFRKNTTVAYYNEKDFTAIYPDRIVAYEEIRG